MASSAAAMTITHFAHAAGSQTKAITTIAAANRKRQKHNFILPSPSSLNCTHHIKKKSKKAIVFYPPMHATFPEKIRLHL